tara:strand:+ start:6196 stop:7884 length:1689 start_codon:yes stop_codon:yes gene_type:complete
MFKNVFWKRRFFIFWHLFKSRDFKQLAQRLLIFSSRVFNSKKPPEYEKWRKKWVEISPEIRNLIRNQVSQMTERPLFNFVIHANPDDIAELRVSLSSILSQLYPEWKVQIVTKNSLDRELCELLKHFNDKRIVLCEEISPFQECWVGQIKPGDSLYETALFLMAVSASLNPKSEILYSDHDHLTPEGLFVDPYMKSDWNPDLLSGTYYFSILTMFKASIWEEYFENSETIHEFSIKATEKVDKDSVLHLPYVLASQKIDGDGSHLTPLFTKPTYEIPLPPPKVSVLIPTKDKGKLLDKCLSSLLDETNYKNFEIVIIDHESSEHKAVETLRTFREKDNVKILSYRGNFNFSEMINKAADSASGEIFVLLNNDIEIINQDWLKELVSHVLRPEVGVVGSLLLFPDLTVQHAGVHPGVGGLMGHGHKHWLGDSSGYFSRLKIAHEVAAVTGACMAIESKTWSDLGGLNAAELAVAYNDVDLCLKAREKGLRVVLNPYSVLIHHESATRGTDIGSVRQARLEKELQYMKKRWGDKLKVDPAYNPNLHLGDESFTLADSPRKNLFF